MNASAMDAVECLYVREFTGERDYLPVWQRMKDFTGERTQQTVDEVWLLEHRPVFTLGVRESAADILDSGTIPVVKTDRGGLVTYHGPGQLLAYILLDLRRSEIGLKALVSTLEQVSIDMLSKQGISSARKENAPGVYVDGKKIASLGLRVMHGCTYHGLSLNVDMDLSPFQRIVPCGLNGIQMTDMKRQGDNSDVREIGRAFVQELSAALGYNPVFKTEDQ